MKILRTIGILALVAGLVLGGGGSALANGEPAEPPVKDGLFGTVDSVSGYDVTLVTKEGLTVVVTLTETAKYMVPGETKGPSDLATFLTKVGDPPAIEGRRIAVLVTFTNESTADAIRLMLIPSPSSPPSHAHRHAHRVGVVDAFTAGSSITIIDKDGEPHPFDLNGTVYRPDDIDMEAITGGCVTVVTTGDPKLGTAIAKAIVLHDELPDWAPEP